MPASQRHKFKVTHNGKMYDCERVVTGSGSKTQRIKVLGVGSEEDWANYGLHGRPSDDMESTAETIASSIIQRGCGDGT
jgi:hypothetical protein